MAKKHVSATRPIAATFLAFALFWLQPAVSREREARPLPASEFAALIERISEDGGFFWNDNFVSNEASYQHPLKKMRELGIRGGVYLGVGPNQNFTYIAKIRPQYAFIVDIRRQNFLEHLMFKALFHFARDRGEYLSLLLSRPVPPGKFSGSRVSVEEIARYFQDVDPDVDLYRHTQARIRTFLDRACRVQLSSQDYDSIDKIRQAFFTRGLGIKYDYIPVPNLGEFLLERDVDGNRQNFLNSAEEFAYIKRLQEENRIIPLVGDFAGPHALKELGAVLREWDEKVTVFYASNVEQYLLRNLVWPQFLRNAAELPFDERAVFIRAYWSNRTMHPEVIPGYSFTSVLQWAKPFLQTFDPAGVYNYWDVVTTGTIKLH
jgi:hypothetical protein